MPGLPDRHLSRTVGMTHHVAAYFTVAALAAIPMLAAAGDANPFELVEDKPLSELWINPGFYSYHFDR
jgi:hypothetical protein